MTWAGRSRSRSLALPVSARTRRTSPGGNVLAITPRLTWSLTRMPAGRLAGTRAIVVARPRASASMAQLCPYVNCIVVSPDYSRAIGVLRVVATAALRMNTLAPGCVTVATLAALPSLLEQNERADQPE